jgi:hypothetical protein
MAKPKLCLIPATIGDKVYSILPSDGVGDFDFTRASTATRINAQGLIETVASGENRLNYSLLDGKVVGCPHLLLENSATNLIQYSEDISNAVWTTLASGETIVSNSVISPDGTLNADTLEGDGTAATVYVRQDVTLSTSTDYTFSIFAKKGTNNFLAISAEGFSGATNTLLIFDLNNGIVTNGTANIEDFGNGWFRCIFTIAISTDGTGRFLIYPAYNGTTRGFPSSSDADGQNIYLWGAMLEQSSFATSYIRNLSTGSTTRAAETCNGSGDAATFNDSEGVLMAEISALANDITNRIISVSDGSGSNRVLIKFDNSSNLIQGTCTVGTDQASLLYYTNDITINSKVLFLYKSNDFQLWVDGFKRDFDTNGTTPSGLDRLNFDNSSGGSPFYGNTKQIQYFDSVLDSEQLEQLTSWDSFRAMAEGQLYSIQ